MPISHFDRAREFLANKDNDPTLLQEVLKISGPKYAEVLFALVRCEEKRAKNRAAKLMAQLSEREPKLIVPYWNRLVEEVNGKENILRWNALIAFGQICEFDSDQKIQSLLPLINGMLEDESMVTVGHAIACLGKIAKAHPQQRKNILHRLMTVHESTRAVECNQILIGKVLVALEPLILDVDAAELSIMLNYAKEQEQSSRVGTQKLATKLSKKIHLQYEKLKV